MTTRQRRTCIICRHQSKQVRGGHSFLPSPLSLSGFSASQNFPLRKRSVVIRGRKPPEKNKTAREEQNSHFVVLSPSWVPRAQITQAPAFRYGTAALYSHAAQTKEAAAITPKEAHSCALHSVAVIRLPVTQRLHLWALITAVL